MRVIGIIYAIGWKELAKLKAVAKRLARLAQQLGARPQGEPFDYLPVHLLRRGRRKFGPGGPMTLNESVLLSRGIHNAKVGGSIPLPATNRVNNLQRPAVLAAFALCPVCVHSRNQALQLQPQHACFFQWL